MSLIKLLTAPNISRTIRLTIGIQNKENAENLSANIDIEDVTLKGSQFDTQGYNTSISVKNIKVDDDSYLGLSTEYGDGNLEMDGATVSSSGRILIYGSSGGKETVKLQNISIAGGAMIRANAYGGDDADTIIFSGKGSTVDATDNSDVITVKKDSNAVLDFGAGNLDTVTSTSADVNFSAGKLQLTSGSVDGTVKLSALPDNFTLNGKTYTTKTFDNKEVLTYTKDGTTYLYDGELDFDNLTTADLAKDKWIAVALVTVSDKTFALDSEVLVMGEGANVITGGNGTFVKADSADKITVTKNKSAVIQIDDKSATVTALDVDAENWKGNISGNATLKLPKGTFTRNGTAARLIFPTSTIQSLTLTPQEIKLRNSAATL